MEVRSCRSCRRLFNYIGGQMICPACKEELERKFYVVKEYIREHPQANIPEVAREADVSTKQLKQWVREERLQFSEDSDIALQCEKCGAKIFTGRYCENCKNNLANGLSKAFEQDKPAEAPKKKEAIHNAMRFKH